MENQNPVQSTDVAALIQQLQQMQNSNGTAPLNPLLSGWQKPQPQAFGVQAVNVPVSLQTSAGKVRVYFQLPAEVAASPDALMNAIENMIAAGIPVDAWGGSSSDSWGGRNNSNGYRRNYRRY
ncbi:MAG: hypothetical protein KDE57_12980 [Calditrichaeota bacterium]|nr:hypothetical protein [Calditrichota bacterium]MCB0287563.1 hypothetical protein [Calditrichota bacterium]